MTAALFMVEQACRCKRKGIVGLRNNLLKKEWADMCGAAYNPDAVNNKPKIHGVSSVEEAPPTGGRGSRRRGTKWIPTWSKAMLALKSMGIQECSSFEPPVGCVSLKFALLMQMEHPMRGDTHTKSCLSTRSAKRANILRHDLRDYSTSQ